VQTIFSAIHRLKLRAVNDDSECYRAVDLLDAIANAFGYDYVDSPQSKDTLSGAIAELKLQNQANANMAEHAIAASKNSTQSIEAIAAQLGIDFNGNTEQIHEAITDLKTNLSIANESLRGIADRLDLDRFDDEQVAAQIEELKDGADPVAKQDLLAIAHSLELGYFNREEALAAIANLKHSLQLSQKEVDELQEKAAIADELQSALINTDFGELRSERDYYRGILGKLCDRLNTPDIEALEHIAIHQEMSLDFIDQHNDDLREKLAASQATNLKYMNRIVDLENELRSLKEPLPESDRLSNAELIQIVRSLLKP